MKKIFKYHLPISDHIEVRLPEGAEILCVQAQGGEVYLWAVVNPEEPMDVVTSILCRGTGHELTGKEGRYLGTAQQFNGALIWHFFEKV